MTGAARKVAVDYGTEQAAMAAYLREGERRALALGNRGPIRFTAQGKVSQALPSLDQAIWWAEWRWRRIPRRRRPSSWWRRGRCG